MSANLNTKVRPPVVIVPEPGTPEPAQMVATFFHSGSEKKPADNCVPVDVGSTCTFAELVDYLKTAANENIGKPKGGAGYFILCSLRGGCTETLPEWLKDEKRANAEQFGYRSDAHVELVYGLAADYDSEPDKAPDLTPNNWPCRTVLYGSHNYGPKTPGKLRALFAPFSRPVTLEEFKRIRVALQQRVPGAVISSRAAHQPVFLPTCPAGKAVQFWEIPGPDTLDVDALLRVAPEPKARPAAALKAYRAAPTQLSENDAKIVDLLASVWQDGAQGDRALGAFGGVMAGAGVTQERAVSMLEALAGKTRTTHPDPAGRGLQAFDGRCPYGWPTLRESLSESADPLAVHEVLDQVEALLNESVNPRVEQEKAQAAVATATTEEEREAARKAVAEAEAKVKAVDEGPIDVTGFQTDFDKLAEVCMFRLGHVRRRDDRWYWFNGRVYELVSDEALQAKVRPVLARCQFVETEQSDSGEDYEVVKDLRPTSYHTREVLHAIRAMPGVMVTEEPDQNRDEVICGNGRVDLRSGKRAPHSPSVFATKMVSIDDLDDEMSPEREQALIMAHERWTGYLEGLGLGTDTTEYLQRGLGYALTGRGSEKAFFFLYGEKDTSKSTLVRLAAAVMGDYAVETEPKDWLEQRQAASGHTDSLMCVAGARLVYGDETGEHARFNAALIKRACGGMGSKLQLSAKGEKGRSVPVTFALFFSSNYLPGTQDAATQSRLKVIEHTKVIENPDPNFQERFLTDEMRQVILFWLLQGAKKYLESGLGSEPASVIVAREEFKSENDWLGFALKELFGRVPDYEAGTSKVSVGDISKALAQYTRDHGMKVPVPALNKLGGILSKRVATWRTDRVVPVWATGPLAKRDGRSVLMGIALRHNFENNYERGDLAELEVTES